MSGNRSSEVNNFLHGILRSKEVYDKLNPQLFGKSDILKSFSWLRSRGRIGKGLADFLATAKLNIYQKNFASKEDANSDKNYTMRKMRQWYINHSQFTLLENAQLSLFGKYKGILERGNGLTPISSSSWAGKFAGAMTAASAAALSGVVILPAVIIKEAATIAIAPINHFIWKPLYYLGYKERVVGYTNLTKADSDKVDDVKENTLKNYLVDGLGMPLYTILYKVLTIPYDIASVPYIGYVTYKATELPTKFEEHLIAKAAEERNETQSAAARAATEAVRVATEAANATLTEKHNPPMTPAAKAASSNSTGTTNTPQQTPTPPPSPPTDTDLHVV